LDDFGVGVLLSHEVSLSSEVISLLGGADATVANKGSSSCTPLVRLDIVESLPCFVFDAFNFPGVCIFS